MLIIFPNRVLLSIIDDIDKMLRGNNKTESNDNVV